MEDNVGSTSVRRAGVAIGERAYETMMARKVSASDPLAMMKALQLLATQVIRDPYKRGWEVTQQQPRHIQMRRTQTFGVALAGVAPRLVGRSDRERSAEHVA